MLPIPIGTDRPQRHFPWMNALLIAANIVLFLVGRSLASAHPDPMVQITGLPTTWDKYMLDPLHPSLYQFISYQFLHQGLSHIGFNMLFLYVFGNNLNEKLGHAGYLAFYLTGGVLAGCGQMLTSNSPTLGASGAISAVAGLFLVLLPRTHIRLFIWIFVYVDVWEIPSMFFILFKIGQDIFEQVAGGSSVAYMAHLSGTAAGILIGLLLILTRLVQRDHYDLLAMINRYRRRQEYRTLVSRGYDPFDATRNRPGKPSVAADKDARPTDPRLQALLAETYRLLAAHETQAATEKYLALRALDNTQVLTWQEQLDVGNQLMSNGQFAEAAASYEDYLRVHRAAPQLDQVTLMLAVIYTRYLPRFDRAKELFQSLIPRLHIPAEKRMAQDELAWLEKQTPQTPTS